MSSCTDVLLGIVAQFDKLMETLAEGDLTLFGAISRELQDVPVKVAVGETYVSCEGHVNWYEVLEPPQDGCISVRVFSIVFRRGEYDRVQIERLTARVSSKLFQRARANGFRSVRAFS